MKITCWGARGSIPVSGKEYVKYGGDTTCVEIRSKNDEVIIIDAGTGIRKLGNRLITSDKRTYHLLFTHAHWDHLMGFPFFKPIYMQGTRLRLFGCPSVQQSVQDILSQTMTTPYFPVEFRQLPAEIESRSVCEQGFQIGAVEIMPIRLSHPNGGIGFRFAEDGKSFVFLTDNELSHRHPGGGEYGDYIRFAANADLLIHDAEYTADQYKVTKGWGHSRYTDALQLAMRAQVKQFGLFHHNQERSDEELDHIVDDCSSIAQKEQSRLKCFALSAGMVIDL
jgi:phosphoribosyl 1,2-cyclic phosphodiesterase